MLLRCHTTSSNLENLSSFHVVQSSAFFHLGTRPTKFEQPTSWRRFSSLQGNYAHFVSLGPWNHPEIFIQLLTGQALVQAAAPNTTTSRGGAPNGPHWRAIPTKPKQRPSPATKKACGALREADSLLDNEFHWIQ